MLNPYAFLTSAIAKLPTNDVPASYVKNAQISIDAAAIVLGGIIFPVHFGNNDAPCLNTIAVSADNADTCDTITENENIVPVVAGVDKLVNVIVAPVMPDGKSITIVVLFTVEKSILIETDPLPVTVGVYVNSFIDFQVLSPAKYVVAD
jgi:hypothetical protein